MSTNFDPLYRKYPVRRYPLYARNGMVASSEPQASAAGLEILRKGGNAMEAAVATAAALTVIEPTANGIGSDAFAIIWSEKDKKLYGINGSGPAPMMCTPERLNADGKVVNGRVPQRGWASINVPGAVSCWAEIMKKFGTLPMTEVLAPAIFYAENGYPMGAAQSRRWRLVYNGFKKAFEGPEFAEWFKTFNPEGRAYEPGEMVTLSAHGRTLREIAETCGESFYRGELAKKIDADSREFGGYLRAEDLAAYHAEWVEPISVGYHGYTVCELPPNDSGLVALMALNILDKFRFCEKDSVETYHKQMEAMKMAFADGLHYITDLKDMPVPPSFFLTEEYGKKRAAEMTETAQLYSPVEPKSSGTVYFCCADKEGNMVSFIQSNYMSFGSGVVIRDTGIALNNRAYDFSLDPKSVNYLRGGKKTYHTIIPAFLMKDGAPVGPFGVMGGYMQPQAHVQVVMNYVDFNLSPQQALDAPRWQWTKGKSFVVESGFDPDIVASLNDRGHDVQMTYDSIPFGKGEMIVRLPNGVYCGGTESRYDGSIALY